MACAARLPPISRRRDCITDSQPVINLKQTDHGNTALILAATWGHPELVKLLLKIGADASIRNRHGKTALDLAKDNGIRICSKQLTAKNFGKTDTRASVIPCTCLFYLCTERKCQWQKYKA